MKETDKIPMLHPQVAARVVDGQALIVLADAGEVMVLNEPATHLWNCIDGRRSLGEIMVEMGVHYGLDPECAVNDTRQFVHQLLEANAVELCEPS